MQIIAEENQELFTQNDENIQPSVKIRENNINVGFCDFKLNFDFKNSMTPDSSFTDRQFIP